MSTSPPAIPSTKRKRKAPRIVDSDDESEFDEQFQKEDTPSGKPTPKKQAITRKIPRKKIVKQDMDQNSQSLPDGEPPGTPEYKSEQKERQKAREIDNERPTKRQRLPPIKKNLPTAASGSGTPVQSSKMAPSASSSSGLPAQRQIVDGPISNDMDLRDPDAFASLFKKARHVSFWACSSLTPYRPEQAKAMSGTT